MLFIVIISKCNGNIFVGQNSQQEVKKSEIFIKKHLFCEKKSIILSSILLLLKSQLALKVLL